MANELLILPLHLTQSALGQKVEAKPGSCWPRESSQGCAVMRGLEVASLPSWMGSPLSRSHKRATPSLAKFVQSAQMQTVRAAARTVADGSMLMASVLHAITSDKWNAHLTDEVPQCPWLPADKVSLVYKSDTKGPTDALATRTGSPWPRPWGCRQRQSRGPHGCGDFERQNLRVPSGPLRSTGPVSPLSPATKWLDGTSSRQHNGSLRNRLTQPENARLAVHQR
jgi:hypothetical protein